jgi:indolepyruvate ferredoxin oxidoreductase
MNQTEILSGNEILVQGALEAGVDLLTGYPGSPLADFFNILYEKKEDLKKNGVHVVIANSEAHAAAMASGAKMAGKNVLVAMKSMGLHVAADALSVGNFANPGTREKSGVVIAVGDDPWSISTSTPADSRFLFKHLHIPFLEPSTPQELKEYIEIALKLSQKSSMYVGILLTTHLAEGGGKVQVGAIPEKKLSTMTLNPDEFNLSENVMVPPNSLIADQKMILKRFPLYLKTFEELNLEKSWENHKSIGVISAGAIFETLKQVLEESLIINEVSLLKLASSYPLNSIALYRFLEHKKYILIVEEKRDFLEQQIRSFIQEKNLDIQVFGKEFSYKDNLIAGFPSYGGLNYEIIYQKLNQFLDLLNYDKSMLNCQQTEIKPVYQVKFQKELPKRLPTFCPGCPHRETLSIMKEIRQNLKDKNINLISHGDVGCYSLSFLEPFKEMHDLSAMGQGGALGAGGDIFVNNPSVVLMGDSTFFHSGMTAISNSVQLGHNITYILLDNDNTAMTGHQMTPVSGISVEGAVRPRQDILKIVEAMKVDFIQEVNPSDRYFYKNLLTDVVLRTGTKVIISNKECALTFHGRQKKQERKTFSENKTINKTFYQINTFACENCLECVEMTGCPGLTKTQDAYGDKVKIDPQICVSDSYCTKIKACPSFEMVEVIDYHPNLYKPNKNGTHFELPLPQMQTDIKEIENGKNLDIVVIGVGGSGVTTISRILATAAKKLPDSIQFRFVDQKGLAQRNGSVTSFISFFHANKSHAQVTAISHADLVISPDLLEGVRALPYLKNNGSLFVDADFQVPLSMMLERGQDESLFEQEKIIEELKFKVGKNAVIGKFKDAVYDQLGKNVYAPAMILGVIFQSGKLPFSLSDIEIAFSETVPKAELSNNLIAFSMGREWWLKNDNFKLSTDLPYSVNDFIKSMKATIYPWQNKERFVVTFRNYLRLFSDKFPQVPEIYWANYIHDLMVYDLGKNLAAFYEDLILLHQHMTAENFKKYVRLLAKTYWIKDEVYVAHLLSSELKEKLDQQEYKLIGKSFRVKHINRPQFVIWGKKIEFDVELKEWTLKYFRYLRLLRILLPDWHKEERQIMKKLRDIILKEVITLPEEDQFKKYKELEKFKGYRDVLYKNTKELIS